MIRQLEEFAAIQSQINVNVPDYTTVLKLPCNIAHQHPRRGLGFARF